MFRIFNLRYCKNLVFPANLKFNRCLAILNYKKIKDQDCYFNIQNKLLSINQTRLLSKKNDFKKNKNVN